MMSDKKFKAGDPFPSIVLPKIDGASVDLAKPGKNYDWRLLVIYRGRHCPLCTRYLNALETFRAQFSEIGVDIVAASADSKAQLISHKKHLAVNYTLTYGLSIKQMQLLGLYISNPRSPDETDHPFAEPGLFVINARGQVQVIDISNGPFVRPELEVLLSGLQFIRNPENDYPIRGTYE